MAKNHGARQQKKLAKQKAKRQEKRAVLARRESPDPTRRLQGADGWPVVHCLAGEDLWKDGLGHLAIARQKSAHELIYALFLVDVFCLGVKDAFWQAGSSGDFQEMIRKVEKTKPMSAVRPECFAKIIEGAVNYAGLFGFLPHRDFRHASRLLEGIDPATCTQDFKYGKDGKPYYIRGPLETMERARIISQRVTEAGGDYIILIGQGGPPDDEFEELDELDLLEFDEEPD